MSLRAGPAEGDGWGGYIAAVALFALSVLAILTSISTAVGLGPGPVFEEASDAVTDHWGPAAIVLFLWNLLLGTWIVTVSGRSSPPW